MSAPSLAFALLAALPFAPTATAPAPTGIAIGNDAARETPRGDEALKALSAWLKLYRAGKIPYQSQENIARHSIALKFGLLPKSGLGVPTWKGDLETILEAVAGLDDAAAGRALVEVAAIGLVASKLPASAAPHEVRASAERWTAKLTSAAAKAEIAKIADGEGKGDKEEIAALRIAALRCLGQLGDPSFRAVIERQLGSADEFVRLHAADALLLLRDEAAAEALIAALQRENSDAVTTAIVRALRSLYARHLPRAAHPVADADAPKDDAPRANPAAAPESTRLATRAAVAALGRSTWRADMALLQLLDEWRAPEAVPALIGILERFRAEPEAVQSGKLSLLLLHRAHELLVSMTGAVFPADKPEQWRELWETQKDKLDVAQKHAPKAAPTTVASGFCGIPVQGSRVLFILDLSGSMEFPMPDKKSTRLDFAQRELRRAMESISPNAQFNLVTFNGDEKAAQWSKNMVPATDRNRERFVKHVDGLRARGGTNLWSGFEAGLKMRSLVYGDRYETNVDEVFILSDGAPSVGDVIDPIEILRLVRETNRFANMRINTIFITSTNPQEQQPMPWMTITPKELMRRLAEENGGKFIGL